MERPDCNTPTHLHKCPCLHTTADLVAAQQVWSVQTSPSLLCNQLEAAGHIFPPQVCKTILYGTSKICSGCTSDLQWENSSWRSTFAFCFYDLRCDHQAQYWDPNSVWAWASETGGTRLTYSYLECLCKLASKDHYAVLAVEYELCSVFSLLRSGKVAADHMAHSRTSAGMSKEVR